MTGDHSTSLRAETQSGHTSSNRRFQTVYTPVPRSRDDPTIERLTWRDLLASYAMIPGFVVMLWAISYPLTGVLALATLAGLSLGGRRLLDLRRCLDDCGRVVFDLGGQVRISIARPAHGCTG